MRAGIGSDKGAAALARQPQKQYTIKVVGSGVDAVADAVIRKLDILAMTRG